MTWSSLTRDGIKSGHVNYFKKVNFRQVNILKTKLILLTPSGKIYVFRYIATKI